MNFAPVIDALALPPDARVDQRVPKKLLLEQGAPTAADKRQIQDGIEEIHWIAALKPTNIGVPEYRDDVREYLEIAVLTVSFRTTAKAARLTELIHRAIPYPIVLMSGQSGKVSLSLAHKRWSQGATGKVVIDEIFCTGSFRPDSPTNPEAQFLASLALANLPVRDLKALYQGIIDRVVALEAVRITGSFALADSPQRSAILRDGLASHAQIQNELAKLRTRAAKEKQFNRRVELNLEIKRLEASLAALASHLEIPRMNVSPPPDYLNGLVTELRKLPAETGWVEFKVNNSNPEEIGEYISALGNTAALHGKANGYLVWGVKDDTHEVVGSTFKPPQAKKGGEELESWLLRLLNPRLHFQFFELTHEGHPVVVLEIPRASGKPIQFQGHEFIRVGSYRQKLKDHPQIEKELWRIFDATPFEEMIALEHADAETVLSLVDYPSYFDLLAQPLPSDRAKILDRLQQDRMIAPDGSGNWNITNLGAILFAKNLDSFRSLSRKAIRVVVYEGKGRLKTVREQVSRKGYASGFEGLIDFVNALLPRNEIIGKAIREEVPMYPEPAIRELIPNALIHQDFSVTGAGPIVEIFVDRMEITNPGEPLVKTERFLDTPPRSRNEALASFMRRIGVCEERGSGVDKVVFQTELYQLPAPIFETAQGSTRAVLFAYKTLREMDRSDRSRACYLHACLRYVERDPMTNSSLRERFGIEEKNSAMASRIIREAMEDGLVRPYDPEQGKKYAKYLPYWA